MKKLFFVCLFSLLFLDIFAQERFNTGDSRTYKSEQLIADFNYLVLILKQAHPSLYRFMPEDSLERCFQTCRSHLDHNMTELDYWKYLQTTVAKIGSGHTKLLLSNSFLKSSHEHIHHIIPFFAYISQNAIYVKKYVNKTDTSFYPNFQVLSIDGQSSTAIIAELRALISGDGYSTAFKDYLLESGDFNKLYYLLVGDKAKFTVTFKTLTGSTKTASIQAAEILPDLDNNINMERSLQKNAYYEASSQRPPDSSLHSVYFPQNNPFLAILKIKSFTYSDYLSFHRSLFQELSRRKIHDLIIDIRNNQGGYDYVCIDLLKKLINKDFYFTVSDEGVTNLKQFESMLKDGTIKENDIQGLVHKSFKIELAANLIQKPSDEVFNGKTSLIINGGTFSAAALFAVALKKQLNVATFGQQTGGGEAGCDGGDILKIRLPNTGLNLELPLLWTNSVSHPKFIGYGLKPDHPLTHSWIDLDYLIVTTFLSPDKN